jgi:hypothetical protein
MRLSRTLQACVRYEEVATMGTGNLKQAGEKVKDAVKK